MPRYATLDQKTLEMALIGFEAERARIHKLMTDLQARLGENTGGVRSARKKRTLSTAARARIAAARPKRKLSAAGRKAIVAATKKRWAAFHKAQAVGAKTKGRKAPVQRVAAASA